ncbi:MAG: hypothetical protein ACXWLV_11140 [Rhizomicrobium sp.]
MTVGTDPLVSIIVLASFKANDFLAARATKLTNSPILHQQVRHASSAAQLKDKFAPCPPERFDLDHACSWYCQVYSVRNLSAKMERMKSMLQELRQGSISSPGYVT